MRILHILRAPVGGLFRHVCDLARVQTGAGHEVGVVCDSTVGGERAATVLDQLSAVCTLGIHRLAMPRLPGPGDLAPLRQVASIAAHSSPEILHGHGAKGGLYARLSARKAGARAIYTPHGGALHYSWSTPQGAVFLAAEKLLLRRTDGLAFVCAFERQSFADKIGLGRLPAEVVHNGLWPHEFAPVKPGPDATDLLFIGELRTLKGVDVLITALAQINQHRPTNLTIVGDGPDRQAFESQVAELGLAERVRFTGALPAREAFALGRVIVIPSRAESFPYIVLEAIAAHMPIIATRVGGIPEILPDTMLAKPNNSNSLLEKLKEALGSPEERAQMAANQAAIASNQFNVEQMGTRITAFYNSVLAAAHAT